MPPPSGFSPAPRSSCTKTPRPSTSPPIKMIPTESPSLFPGPPFPFGPLPAIVRLAILQSLSPFPPLLLPPVREILRNEEVYRSFFFDTFSCGPPASHTCSLPLFSVKNHRFPVAMFLWARQLFTLTRPPYPPGLPLLSRKANKKVLSSGTSSFYLACWIRKGPRSCTPSLFLSSDLGGRYS